MIGWKLYLYVRISAYIFIYMARIIRVMSSTKMNVSNTTRKSIRDLVISFHDESVPNGQVQALVDEIGISSIDSVLVYRKSPKVVVYMKTNFLLDIRRIQKAADNLYFELTYVDTINSRNQVEFEFEYKE